MKRQPHSHSLPSAHPADEQLVAFLDGEIRTPDLETAKAHLDICKECRVRMAFFQECSDGFLALRKTSLQDDGLLQEAATAQFRERLARHAEKSSATKSSFRGTWQRLLTGGIAALSRHRKPALATVVAIALVIATTMTLLDSTASAETILLNAEKYESQHKPDSSHLAEDVLQMEEIDEKTGIGERTGTIVLIRDSVSSAVYTKSDFYAGPPEEITISNDHEMGTLALRVFGSKNVMNSSVLAYLEMQHSFPAPSVSEFRKLIAGRGNQEPSTKRKGNTVEVHYPFVPNHRSGIREAVLFVNRSDYSPTRISLFTGAQNAGHEYRFTRTDFSVRNRIPQLTQLFQAHETVIASAGTRSHAASPAPAPLDYANSHAADAEVAAAQALHEANACLGEEIYVFPMSDGSVWIQGLVDKKERREAIQQALSRLTMPLRAEIYTPEEMKSGARLFAAPDALRDGTRGAADKLAPVQVADLSVAQMAYHDELYNYYTKAGKNAEEAEKQVATFSNELSGLSRWTLLNAWSIKKLEQEFSPARTTGLSSHALENIAKMRQDHIQQIRNSAGKQAEMLAPLLKNSGTVSSGGPSGWQDSETLLNLAGEQNGIVRSLFATSQQSTQKDAALARLAEILHRLSE
jgi:hypothetical protein